MPSLDIIIATYNRPQKVTFLIHQLLDPKISDLIESIIVVDSSDSPLSLQIPDHNSNVVVIHSSHKNQPYQRLLGLTYSKAEFVLFLDDDMEVLNSSFAVELIDFLQCNPETGGLNLKFENVNSFLIDLNHSVLGRNRFVNFFRSVSGYPIISDNHFWLAGIKGKRVDNGSIQYVSGGAFLAKRTLMFKGISSMLFEIFEKKMGMGEDAIIGYSLSTEQKVVAWPRVYFIHNDQQDSTYTSSGMKRFYEKISYSRLFLSLEYARMKSISKMLAAMHYIWFGIWRAFGLLVNFAVHPEKKQADKLFGYLTGMRKGIFQLYPVYLKRAENSNAGAWSADVKRDLHSATILTPLHK